MEIKISGANIMTNDNNDKIQNIVETNTVENIIDKKSHENLNIEKNILNGKKSLNENDAVFGNMCINKTILNEMNIISEKNITKEKSIVNENTVIDKTDTKKTETTDNNNNDNNNNNNINANKKIRILTYNIFMRPPPIHSFESDFKEDRIKFICKELFQNFDVIAFQECFSFGSTRIDKIKEKAKSNGLTYFSNSKKKHSWNIGIDGGLCLLSRYPVINKKQYYFKNGCHSDAYSEKGVLFNEIEMPNGSHLFIFTSHTQASYEHFPNISSESVRVRLSQFTEIREFITLMTTNAKPSDIILLCGDLNVNGRLNKDDGKTHSEEYNAVMSILKGNLSVVKRERRNSKEKERRNSKEKKKEKEKEKEKRKSKEKMSSNEELDSKEKIASNNEMVSSETHGEITSNEKLDSNEKIDKQSQDKEKKKEDSYVNEVSEISEYEVEDLFYNELNEHPVTSCDLFADDYYKEGKGKKSRKCLDYFFKFTKINNNDNSHTENSESSSKNTELAIEDLAINPFDIKDQKFVHLSDHFGLSLSIVSKEK